MKNIIMNHKPKITREDREKLNKHKSVVIWFTGLSGSGKSTLAFSIEEKLHKFGCRTIVLDGDNIRSGISSNLSFNDNDRKENIRRVKELVKLMTEAGVITIVAMISPFNHDRNLVRELLTNDKFIEIYCCASLETCESRDAKGLYKRARSGEIKNFTGIDSPYETPENPDLVIDTQSQQVQDSVNQIMNYIKDKIII